MANDKDKELAESCKAEGNRRFGLQKYAAAIESYTEAICHAPQWDVLYINRALCHKKRADWAAVREDATQALALNSESVKAHFLLGVALLELREPRKGAIEHLNKALELAREKGDKMKDDIWRELARSQYTHWQEISASRKHKRQRLQARLQALLQREFEAVASDGAAAEELAEDMDTMAEVFRSVAKEDEVGEIPNAYRSALMEHLHKVGKFDPVTRQATAPGQLVTNLGLRSATHQYLDDHPWAWSECM
eukprot:jgi/Tetstr1/447509/TSEL_034889.t1